jgi:hypothetical protein
VNDLVVGKDLFCGPKERVGTCRTIPAERARAGSDSPAHL